MKMPVAIYVCYVLFAVHTGIYWYNRTHGKSAQFGVSRVFPDSSNEFKMIADLCVVISFLFLTGAVLYRSFFDSW